jgi:hypothetical protein
MWRGGKSSLKDRDSFVPQSLNSPLHSLKIPNNFKTRVCAMEGEKLALMQNDTL